MNAYLISQNEKTRQNIHVSYIAHRSGRLSGLRRIRTSLRVFASTPGYLPDAIHQRLLIAQDER